MLLITCELQEPKIGELWANEDSEAAATQTAGGATENKLKASFIDCAAGARVAFAACILLAGKEREGMMKRASIILSSVLVLFAVFAVAQNPPPTPKPGPEQKNLNYFAGNWKTTGDLKPGPMGPGGKFSGTDHIEWMPGGFFLVSHSNNSSSMGKETGLAVYGYDADKKVYTYDEFSSRGEAVHATGSFDGKVWTWTSEMNTGGNSMKGHFILTETSATAYTYKFEMSQDGTNWAPVMDGTGTKVASAGTAKKK